MRVPARPLLAVTAAVLSAVLTGATATAARTTAVPPVTAAADTSGRPAVELADWPRAQGDQLEKLIGRFEGRGRYAVFDADNTIWRYDLEESLLPFLEMKGVLTPDTVDPSLRLVPFRAGESLYGYYNRLCEIDDKVCYPWIAQVFSGLTLGELKRYVDELYAYGKPIPVSYDDAGKTVHGTVNPPHIYAGQRELIRSLREHGIRVYVMTAAHEELVRMVVSDPKYGLDVPPENVIGVTTLLKDPETGRLTTARKQIEQGTFGAEYGTERYRRQVVTPYLWTPGTWYVGKLAGIHDYIAEYERPVLVAGDSPSDWWMLFYSDAGAGGARLWVDRKQAYTDRLETEKEKRSAEQKAAGETVDAGREWVTVKPAEIGG